MSDKKTAQQYANRVHSNHYLHWLALFSVALWAGGVFGWLWGVATFFALVLTILITNSIILAVRPSSRLLAFNRWAWVVVAALWIVLSTATIERVAA